MNEYDSERFCSLLFNVFGFVRVFRDVDAELLVLNTCSIREKSYFKVFSILGKWKLLKENNSNIIIVVLGCVAKQLGFLLFTYASFVDFVLGPQSYMRFPELLISFFLTRRIQCSVTYNALEKFLCFPVPTNTNFLTGYVTIMEGCSKFCSYCIVPFTRGVEISRSLDDVVVEVVALSCLGVIEVVLLGQNVNDYHSDMFNFVIADFSVLLTYICRIENIKRVRFLTSHPLNFKVSLICLFKREHKLAKFIHLPLQSGSNNILKKMKRVYTVESYKLLIDKLQRMVSYLNFSTDIIIGFPGETHYDFCSTLKVVDSVCFDYSYCFVYSKRPNTEANNFFDIVSLCLKKKRLSILQKYFINNVLKINNSVMNSLQRILVIGSLCSSNVFFGYTDNNRMVFFYSSYILFKCSVFIFINTFRSCIFFGELIESTERCQSG